MKTIVNIKACLGLLAVALLATAVSCTDAPEQQEGVARTQEAVTTPPPDVPCTVRGVAVTANTGKVFSNASSRVDSYRSSVGPYGGTNVTQGGTVRAATEIVNNGGIIEGNRIPNSPAGLATVPVPSNARKLPLGASTPGDMNINTTGSSITLAPGSYVVRNLNVNFPGAIKIQPAGIVKIWVTGTLNLGGNENLNGSPNNLTFLVEGTSSLNVNSNGKLFGNIYAPRAPVLLNSTVFGTVVGATVTLNSGAAVHLDQALACAPPPIAVKPPRTLPLPPRAQGCYVGVADGWKTVPCTAPGDIEPDFIAPEPTIFSVPNPGTIPFQFGEVETTFVAFGTERDSVVFRDNTLSVQANTNFFPATNGHQGWVQFVIQSDELFSINPLSAVCVWNFDITVYNQSGGLMGYEPHCVGGSTNGGFHVAKRPGAYRQFDWAAIGGSTYLSDQGQPSIGMVAKMSWWDPAIDPNNDRGLYSVVAPDTYGLGAAGSWTQLNGTVFGMGNASSSVFTDSSVLTRVLAGSCANAQGPAPAIPWPGVCPTAQPLLPHTAVEQRISTGETSNLMLVGSWSPLVAFSQNLVATQFLTSTSGACMPGGNRAFVRDAADDTGSVPSNPGGEPFWESPDLFMVPAGSPVALDAISSESLVTPGGQFDVWVRINNDFGCSDVTGVRALVNLAEAAALSTNWVSLSNGQFQGPTANPTGSVTVPAGGRVLLGPYRFTAPTTGFGDGHKCLLAAIESATQTRPSNTLDAPASFQVAQRNIQVSDCAFPLTNATTSNGFVQITLGVPSGAVPALSGATNISVSFDDPVSTFYNAWLAGQGTAYALSQSGGRTIVRLGQRSVALARAALAAGASVTALANPILGPSQPATSVTLSATLTDSGGATLVTNGGTCMTPATPAPPNDPG